MDEPGRTSCLVIARGVQFFQSFRHPADDKGDRITPVSRSAHGQPRAKLANTIVFSTRSALVVHALYTMDFPSVATVARGTGWGVVVWQHFFSALSHVEGRF